MPKLNKTVDVDRTTTGAYIELFERDGKPVGRMNFFDGDHPRTAAELRNFHKALGTAIEILDDRERETEGDAS